MYIKNKKIIILFILSCLLIQIFLYPSCLRVYAINDSQPDNKKMIDYPAIIHEGLSALNTKINSQQNLLSDLETWFTQHPQISYVSLIKNSMTICFIDGHHIIIFDIFSSLQEQDFISKIRPQLPPMFPFSLKKNNCLSSNKTALLLHPSEYLYGHFQCWRISNILSKNDYTITYRENEDVNIPYLRQNLTADILYMNTHAGYWDIDGDQIPDQVVIGTGEHWTNNTTNQYAFDYQHHLIVEGLVGNTSFIAITPAFIRHYYASISFPESFIFMATCFGTYDDSMAQAFLESGAQVYLGWSQNTVFYTNSIVSVLSFRLLAHGLSVSRICDILRTGSLMNFLLGSKLTYFGNGAYTI